MNFLFLSQTFPDAGSPARGTYNLALCRELAEEHSVRVLAPRSLWEMLRERWLGNGAYKAGPLVESAGLRAAYPVFWSVPRFQGHRLGRRMSKAVLRTARRWQLSEPIDAVLSYWAHPDGYAALDIAQRAGVPSACIVGGSDVLILPAQHRKRRAEIVRVLKETDVVITVSEGLRKAVMELGVPPERVHTVYQGVDERTFWVGNKIEARTFLNLPRSIPIFLWVGRMVPVKQVDILLKAAAHLHGKGMRFRLYLLGSGPLKKSMQSLAEHLSLGPSVQFMGSVGHDELSDWYRAADVTVLSSRSEGLPNVFRESLACGTPFVSSDVGSIREIARDDYSILVPPGDFRALSEALVAATAESYRKSARQYEARTWQEAADEIVELFKRLKQGGSSRSVPGWVAGPMTSSVVEDAASKPNVTSGSVVRSAQSQSKDIYSRVMDAVPDDGLRSFPHETNH